jgi:hypothetical protein
MKSCCKEVRPQNSARMFHGPSPVFSNSSVRKLVAERRGGRVLELGGGCLRNALYLQRAGFNVTTIEVKGVEERFPSQYRNFRKRGGLAWWSCPPKIRDRFDLVVATFVIETICDPDSRKRILVFARMSLRSDGKMIMSVRGPSDLVTARATGRRCSDGFITPNFTFARAHNRAQLKRFLLSCGFNKIEFLHKQKTVQPEYLHVIAWR